MTTVTIDINAQELVEGIDLHGQSENDIIELIKAIDLRIADVEFTEKLISDLVDSLKSDLPPDELNHFLRRLSV